MLQNDNEMHNPINYLNLICNMRIEMNSNNYEAEISSLICYVC